MNKKLKYLTGRNMGRSLWLAALAALLAVQGCVTIDDNTDDCFPLARLQFVYTYNLDGEDRFRDQVESLDLYVYRQKDSVLVATRSISRAEMVKQNYNISLNWLRLGNYYIVAFGNRQEDSYSCQNYERMATMRLRMICGDGLGTITKNPPHFFYGLAKLNSSDTGSKVVEMIKDTNDINLTIRNKTRTRASGTGEGLPDLEISVTAANGTLKHDNSIAEDDARLMKHISVSEFPQYAHELQTKLTVGRLFKDDGARVIIKEKETGRELSTDNLTDKIVELLTADHNYDGIDPNEYLDRKDSYSLVYDVEMKYGVLVTTLVSIENWNTVENPIGGI